MKANLRKGSRKDANGQQGKSQRERTMEVKGRETDGKQLGRAKKAWQQHTKRWRYGW